MFELHAVLTWLCLAGRGRAASHCFGCSETVMDCDADMTVCRSRCQTKVACDSEDAYCVLATYLHSNASTRPGEAGGGGTLLADLSCFSAGPLRRDDVTTHYCGVVPASYDYPGDFSSAPEEGIANCLCTHDYCNDAVYLEGAEVPRLPDLEGGGGGGSDGTAVPNSPATPGKTPAKGPSSTPNDLGNPPDGGTDDDDSGRNPEGFRLTVPTQRHR